MEKTKHPHLAVYIDHRAARLLTITKAACTERRITRDGGRHGHVHHHAGTPGAGHAPLDKNFLQDIASALEGAGHILILGPGEAKFEVARHLQQHVPALHARVIGVEKLDQRGAAGICAFARPLFRKAELMAAAPGR